MMQILGLLGMYFDAVVVEVEKSLLFFQIGSGLTVARVFIVSFTHFSPKMTIELKDRNVLQL